MNHTLRAGLAGAIGAVGLAACQQPAVDAAAVRQTLREDEAQWNADFKTKDATRLATHYASDATVMIPGAAAAKGVDGVQQAVKAQLADPAAELSFAAEKVGVARSGDLAYARGPYRLTITNPLTGQPFTQTGSYITIYRRQSDGGWKAVERIATVGDGVFTPIPPH